MKTLIRNFLQLSAICGVIALATIDLKPARGNPQPESPLSSQKTIKLAQATSNNTINGTLDQNSHTLKDKTYYQVHPLEGQVGEEITIEVISSDFNAYLILLDPEGNKIEEDDGGEETNARLIVKFSQTGTYQIIVSTTKAGEGGNYTLSWREPTARDRKLAQAEALNQQVIEFYQKGEYEAAIPLAQQALAIREEILGANHRDTAQSLNNLALLYLAQGKYNAAEPLYRRALAIHERVLGANHPDTATSLNNLAGLYYSQNRIPQAIDHLTRGTDIEEDNLALRFTTGSEKDKQDYIKTISGTTNSTISLHLQAAPNNPDAARLAFTTLLRRKGRILEAQTQTLQAIYDNLTPENQQLLDQLAATRSQLAALIYQSPPNSPEKLEAYRTQISTLKTQHEQLEASLSQRSAAFRTANQPATIEAIQQLIPADTTLVEFVLYQPFNPKDAKTPWGEPRYAAYLLTDDGQLQWIDLGTAEPIDNAIIALRTALKSPDFDVKANARHLDSLLMQPIRSLLGTRRHLLISPDSQLNLIPFAALIDENNQYLLENYLITDLTTGRDLLRLSQTSASAQSPLIIANPDYRQPGADNPSFVATQKPTRGNDKRRSTDIGQLSFLPLPGTASEVEALAPMLPQATLLTQSNATENALKQVTSPSILHLATHGFFLEDVEQLAPTAYSDSLLTSNGRSILVEPRPEAYRKKRPPSGNAENPLLRSGLALAGFNPRQSGAEDGVLTALEVLGLRLRGTKLIVLSACETGVGDVANGEGVYGLRRAFLMAGGESQLFSLWKVDDEGTKDLMVNYYRRVLQKREARGEALRQVQLEMLTSENYQHPYYWASFIFSGNWQRWSDFRAGFVYFY